MESTNTSFFNDLITMEELLALLKNQYSKYTIYRWVQHLEIPHMKIKGKLWFSEKEICDWIKRGCN